MGGALPKFYMDFFGFLDTFLQRSNITYQSGFPHFCLQFDVLSHGRQLGRVRFILSYLGRFLGSLVCFRRPAGGYLVRLSGIFSYEITDMDPAWSWLRIYLLGFR